MALVISCTQGCTTFSPEEDPKLIRGSTALPLKDKPEESEKTENSGHDDYGTYKTYKITLSKFDTEYESAKKTWLKNMNDLRPEANSYSWRRQGLTAGGALANVAAVTLLASSPANIAIATGLASTGTGILTFQAAGDAEGYTREALLDAANRTERQFLSASDTYAEATAKMDSALEAVVLIQKQSMKVEKPFAPPNSVLTAPMENYREELDRYNSFIKRRQELELNFLNVWPKELELASKSLVRMQTIAQRGIITSGSDEDIAELKKQIQALTEQLNKPQGGNLNPSL